MSELSLRFREVLLDGKWIANTNFQELIADLTWQQATQQVANLNTIAALTFHINYYVAGVLKVLEGGDLEIRDKYSFDMPPIQSPADWDALKQDFLANAENFAQRVAALSEKDLRADFVDKKYGSYQRNIDGMIEHAYYHLGQVSLIKKMILQG